MAIREVLSGVIPRSDFRAFLATHPSSILIEIIATQGSTPREAGTFMFVSEHAIWGTIGGGQFEFLAIQNARELLSGHGVEAMDIPLGPEIGQCCGGRSQLRFQKMTTQLREELEAKRASKAEHRPETYLFGAGHVGHALAGALAPLPLCVTVVETRKEELANLPAEMKTVLSPMPEALVRDMPAGSAVVILTHDHALDFLIAKEALCRTDLAYVGMIGSATKRATFSRWLVREGGDKASLDRLTLPIGGNSVKDKRPEVIAAMTAAELLTAFAAYRIRSSS
ncbi:xanthine dehydrogenase accessory protein XdhC [Rhizobium calliandrae]|uniref:Xanthine dehydrogenase accessory protein XdhC n=1 Tax=Rhizobium calliandrae TaxID=1312182 RepID=A0ABT7KN04_9HYPH|nr:xanthine dehydrogenase accessory protein XdhC [Rhizobium calliandrae]MDL2409323.1 xanthine dehydrogenase accessory protein XdhC [Rhizobium calliandrae]